MIESKRLFLEQLISSHGQALKRFLTKKMNSPEEAEEVAQETFLRLYKLDDLGELNNARAFMFQTASNMAIDQLRRSTLHKKYIDGELSRDPLYDSNSPDRIITAQEQLKDVYEAIEKLPIKCRQAFLLHRKSGMSYSMIAKEMNISVSSVEKYILQALKQCRQSRR